MNFKRKLPVPKELKEEYPITEEMGEIVKKRDKAVSDIITGEDDMMLLVIGPCSADHEDPVIDYISRLAKVQEKVKDKIFIVPRIYTNKPRTVGTGYKGMLHQPDPEKGEDMLKGVIAIRNLHIRAIRDTGFTCADEMLYPENHRYLSDVLNYVAIGARSVENQGHSAHTFLYRGWEVESTGNPLAHTILRGAVDKYGRNIPNYHYEDLQEVIRLYAERDLVNPAIVVDTNHSNSGKQFMEQIRISKDVLHSRNVSADIRKIVKGLMIESYIEDGSQKENEHVYGKSITDPCLGWEKTEKLIYELADMW